MVMENKDDPSGMKKLLNEIGAHHFFYDAAEPHLEVHKTQKFLMQVAGLSRGNDRVNETCTTRSSCC